MPRKLEINTNEFLKAVESEVPPNEIMKRFGIKTRAQLGRYYLNALVDAGKVKPLGGKRVVKIKELRVNSKGALVIPKSVMEAMGLSPGDIVDVKQGKSALTLKPGITASDDSNGVTKQDHDHGENLEPLKVSP